MHEIKFDKYLIYLNENNFSKKTIEAYLRHLNECKEIFNSIAKMKDQIMSKKAAASQHTHYSVIHSYMVWAKDPRISELEKIRMAKIEMKYREVITKKELMNKTEIKPEDDYQTQQKKMLMRFLFETGIRIGELPTIFDMNKDSFFVHGKGNKVREVFYNNKTTTHLDFDVVTRFSYKTMRLWVKEILGDKYSPHSLRRSCATHLLSTGASPKMVQLQLGHEKIDTTFRYMNLNRDDNISIYSKYMKK